MIQVYITTKQAMEPVWEDMAVQGRYFDSNG